MLTLAFMSQFGFLKMDVTQRKSYGLMSVRKTFSSMSLSQAVKEWTLSFFRLIYTKRIGSVDLEVEFFLIVDKVMKCKKFYWLYY
jgi:hypothetical protein